MGVLIDTTVFVALERAGRSPEVWASDRNDDSAAVAAVTAAELLHGVHRAESAVRRGRREHIVEAVLETVEILPFSLDVARVHARLWADLASRGEVIAPHDMMIAATALHHRLSLLTQNRRHFDRVDGLEVVLWTGP